MKEVNDTGIVFADELAPATLNRRVKNGDLRRLARGIYTPDTTSPPDTVVKHNWMAITGHEFPDAVVTDRSAPTGGPVDGVLYIASRRRRHLELPGLAIASREGAGPLPDDIALPGGIYLASRPRALVENTKPSRARRHNAPRTLTDRELADWVNRLCELDGEDQIAEYRTRATEIASAVGATDGLRRLSQLIGAAIGSQRVETSSPALTARQDGHPIDPVRVSRFDTLLTALRAATPQSRNGVDPGSESFRIQAFFEAYFSNFIEGTTFELDEAAQIVFEGRPVENRPADSHDVAGTFAVVSDAADMTDRLDSPEGYIDALRSRHAVILAGRPADHPGLFKETANRAGQTEFVHPSLVEGTLREGFRRAPELDTAWERAVYVAFVVAEVHPFDDGNGRVARAMMNGELVAAGQSKIIVPTGYRDEYLGALRRLTRQDDPSILIKAMRVLHDYTSQINWSTFEAARGDLDDTNAFNDDADGPRLHLRRAYDEIPPLSLPDEDPPTAFVAPYMRNGHMVSGYRKPARRR